VATAESPDSGFMTNSNPAGDGAPRRSPKKTAVERPGGVAAKVQLRAGSADAVLAMVPHMLGFYPDNSLVVLGLGDRSLVRLTFRYDLPDPPDDELAVDIAEHACHVLGREKIPSAMLIGYGSAELVAPVMERIASRLLQAGVELHEVLHAEGGRFRSLLCSDESCCPANGRPYDPGSHPAAAAMADAGLGAYPDRAALVRSLQPIPGTADQIRRATNDANMRLADVVIRGPAESEADPLLRVTRIGRAAVQRAIRSYRRGDSITNRDQLAWLAVLLTDLRVRDDAWARMDPGHQIAHSRLWTDVLRSAAPECVPAPACLLAFVAWQSGNGALAAVAVERALTADHTYSMASLLAGAIAAGLPSSAARMPMSPADVAGSYAKVSGKNSRKAGAQSGGGRRRQAGVKHSGGGRSRAAESGRGRGGRSRSTTAERNSGSSESGRGTAAGRAATARPSTTQAGKRI